MKVKSVAACVVLLALLNLLRCGSRLMKLRFEDLGGLLTDGQFHKSARFTAFRTREAFGLHFGLTVGSDDDLDGFRSTAQATPPTRIVSLMEPSLSGCSKTECPFLRASNLAFSTA